MVRLPAESPWAMPQVRAALAQALTGGVTVLIADMTAAAWSALAGLQVLLRSRDAAGAASPVQPRRRPSRRPRDCFARCPAELGSPTWPG